ncbi:MAG: ferritin [Candidatus Cloacimonadota bacterium]|nr:MAG: ferritin [Candidatus Cloacimonadota bacterium]
MLKDKILKALNTQLNAELYSAYLYLSMSAFFESTNLRGFANWMKVQAQEEYMHTMKFYDYILEYGSKVQLMPIDGPQTEWDSSLAVFEHVYKHEQKVTGLINDLVDLARSENDHETSNFLQWFVNEQVEEEASADAALQKIKRAENSPDGLFTVDKDLGKRVFTPPAQSKE